MPSQHHVSSGLVVFGGDGLDVGVAQHLVVNTYTYHQNLLMTRDYLVTSLGNPGGDGASLPPGAVSGAQGGVGLGL